MIVFQCECCRWRSKLGFGRLQRRNDETSELTIGFLITLTMSLPFTYCVSKLFCKASCKINCYSFRLGLRSSSVSHLRAFLRRSVFRNLNGIFLSSRGICSLRVLNNNHFATIQKKEISSQDVMDKVKYNCILSEEDMKLNFIQKKRYRAMEAKKEQKLKEKEPDIPFSVKYLDDNLDVNNNSVQGKEENIILPFKIKYGIFNHVFEKNDESFKFFSDRAIDSYSNFSEGVIKSKDWLKNHEFYCDNEQTSNVAPMHLNYGTVDRRVPVTSVPCGGCGAYLQCQDTGIPGYLPSELIKNCSTAELRALKCQRCHFLEKYNMALNLNVSPEEYPRLLNHFKNQRALAILIIDLVDFPCSLWPGILEIIGKKRPVIVVGNKVDLLPCDSSQFLSYAQSWLEEAVQKTELVDANIKHVVLISAQTGFGVEELITKIHVIWGYQGDIYLLGCTNVGKSTLFNALLKSDLCKVQAVDIMQRATTSLWPGTTLNLLKFPIFRPDGWRLYQRVERLKVMQIKKQEQMKMLRKTLKKKKDPHKATLIGHIGCTFQDLSNVSTEADPFSVVPKASGEVQLTGLDPNNKDFAQSKWCYDTPGTVHPDQIIDILTAQELVHLLPREMILPRTFSLYCGDTLLIGGIGRLDFQSGPEKVWFTVFAAKSIPLTVCRTSDVDVVYSTLAASNLLMVPSSNAERLSLWPGLTAYSHSFEITGIHRKESAADIVLSSAGWIAVTPEEGEKCVVKAWTPFARGIYFRQPALLRFSVNLRGKKVRKSPAYLIGKAVKI